MIFLDDGKVLDPKLKAKEEKERRENFKKIQEYNERWRKRNKMLNEIAVQRTIGQFHRFYTSAVNCSRKSIEYISLHVFDLVSEQFKDIRKEINNEEA